MQYEADEVEKKITILVEERMSQRQSLSLTQDNELYSNFNLYRNW